jgi:hypothetical protein
VNLILPRAVAASAVPFDTITVASSPAFAEGMNRRQLNATSRAHKIFGLAVPSVFATRVFMFVN